MAKESLQRLKARQPAAAQYSGGSTGGWLQRWLAAAATGYVAKAIAESQRHPSAGGENKAAYKR